MTDMLVSPLDARGANRVPRPLLARVADAVYWMARYVERAEHLARALQVNTDLLTDVGDVSPVLRDRLWQGIELLTDANAVLPASVMTGVALERHMAHHMTLDAANPHSIISCLTKARENARSIRENISAEIWESLNTLYWHLQSDEVATRFEEAPAEVYRTVLNGSLLLQGLTDQTLAHTQPWMFAQVGKYLERVEMTCRILHTKHAVLQPMEQVLELPLRNLHWMAVLRSVASLEAYRRTRMADFDPARVAEFVVFEPAFPRSVRYSVYHAQACAARIREQANPSAAMGADRILGRLDADLEYADHAAVGSATLPGFLAGVRQSIGHAAAALHRAYFLQ